MKRRIALFAIVGMFIVLLSGCRSTTGFKGDIEDAIEDGTITYEAMKEELKETNNELVLNADQKKYLTKVLTEFQGDNDLDKALNLLWITPGEGGYNSFIDGSEVAAYDDFINWIKQAVLDGDEATKKYRFEWHFLDQYYQFKFNKIGDNRDKYLYVFARKNRDSEYSKPDYFVGKGNHVDFINESFCNIQNEYTTEYEQQEAAKQAAAMEKTSSDVDSSSNTSNNSGKGKKCPWCNGTGSVKYYYGSSAYESIINGHEDSWYGQCGACHGTGKL